MLVLRESSIAARWHIIQASGTCAVSALGFCVFLHFSQSHPLRLWESIRARLHIYTSKSQHSRNARDAQQAIMSSQVPCQSGHTGALVAFDRTDGQPWPCSPNLREPSAQDLLRELRQLIIQSISNGDVCIKTLTDFWASSSDWNRRIFEQGLSHQRLEEKLIMMTHQLGISQNALQRETAFSNTLKQALAVEKESLVAERESRNEVSVQLELCREANIGLRKANENLSKALCNLTG